MILRLTARTVLCLRIVTPLDAFAPMALSRAPICPIEAFVRSNVRDSNMVTLCILVVSKAFSLN